MKHFTTFIRHVSNIITTEYIYIITVNLPLHFRPIFKIVKILHFQSSTITLCKTMLATADDILSTHLMSQSSNTLFFHSFSK